MPDIFGNLTSEEIQLQEEEKKREQEKMKELSKSVSKSAFWLSYCAMQKTIRRGDVDASNKFAFVAHLSNPWLMFRRLHTILFEDVGGANIELVRQFARFYKDGGTFKSFSDVSELVKGLASSIKNRDCDEMKNVVNSKNILPEYLNDEDYLLVKKIQEEGFDYYYNNDDYELLRPLVEFTDKAREKLAGEGQNLFVPFAVNKFAEKVSKGEVQAIDQIAKEGTDLVHNEIFPYTVLDMHGWHGQTTMKIAWAKLQEKLPSFIKEYNLGFNAFEMAIFHLEGSLCRDEVRLTNIREISWKSWYYDLGMLKTYEEFCDDFREIIRNRLNPLRKWTFEKRFKDIVLEIETIVKNNMT